MSLKVFPNINDESAFDFCYSFIENPYQRHRYVFGCNVYAESIAKSCDIDGFIDDINKHEVFFDKPVLKSENVPKNSLIVSAVVLGRPLTAKKHLIELNLEHLDYFSFYKYSGLKLEPVTFWEDFKNDFSLRRKKYEWLNDLLYDRKSKNILEKLINFRLSGNLKYMYEFRDIQHKQYFESFLHLDEENETFIDVGGFEGETTMAFINRCPRFEAVYFFEPEKKNINRARQLLKNFDNIYYYNTGLADKKGELSFSINGSSSKIDETGDMRINVNCLDDILPSNEHVTFIKMDIEGAEKAALEGAKHTIMKQHPRLAICVYHKGDDLWRIPEQVLSYYPDYNIYLRHYTEGVVETVMFFIDKNL